MLASSFFGIACWLLTGTALAWQPGQHGVKRLYVEEFATKAGAEALQHDLALELRKLSAVSLVSQEANADVIVGGGGEIWIRGYRSLNPRSDRLLANGTPVYTGYLSVELKDNHGVTLWSDLVTPGGEPGDISKDLAKRIVRHLAEALDRLDIAQEAAAPPGQAVSILNGAGATFPYPVYAKWFTNYRRENSVQINYDSIGSEAGIRRLVSGGVDFAASDSPEALGELAPAHEGEYLLLPSVVGAVVPIVNLPGIPAEILFTPEALAGIFLGKIKKWNDPLLTRSNRGVHLPDLDIVVVHRAEGSGTSYAWTDYLSRASPEWKAEVGASLLPHWPTGRGAFGNDGVAKLVKELAGSIGYVEFIYALQNHLSYGKVRNRNGEFLSASLETIAAAVNRTEIHEDFKASIVDVPGSGAYPIASFTWMVVPRDIGDDDKRGAMVAFLRWMLGPGQQQAAALGYLGLPRDIVSKELDAIAKIR